MPDLWGPIVGAGIALIAAVLVPFATGEYSRRAEERRATNLARRTALTEALGILDARWADLAAQNADSAYARTLAYQRALMKIASFLDPKQAAILRVLNLHEGKADPDDIKRTAIVLSRWADGAYWWYAKRPVDEYLRESVKGEFVRDDSASRSK